MGRQHTAGRVWGWPWGGLPALSPLALGHRDPQGQACICSVYGCLISSVSELEIPRQSRAPLVGSSQVNGDVIRDPRAWGSGQSQHGRPWGWPWRP